MSNETMNHETNDNMADLVPAGDAISDKLADALTPGYQAEFDPDEAERAGAFIEDALTEQDAAESGDDLADLDAALEPAFLDDDGPSGDLPPMPTLTNTRELFGLREGETVADAIARRDQKAED
ncbi:hypothetical protein ACTWP6_29680 [Mycobacterium sp. 4D054]|uniref:hypothetical protein n=1 Tax=Mycobacterium sp. 4D054 TaxID=3457440 RepID=UPI003FD34FD6